MLTGLSRGLRCVMTLDAGHRRRAGKVAILGYVINVTEGDWAQLRFLTQHEAPWWLSSVPGRRGLSRRSSDISYRP